MFSLIIQYRLHIMRYVLHSPWRRCIQKCYCDERFVLGLESSCDDTGAAIVTNRKRIMSEALHAQTSFSTRMGGVIPNLAKIIHESNIDDVVSRCLDESNLTLKQLSAVAVTVKPGILSSLKVGNEYAKSLSKKYHIPLIPIHHMYAHALTARLTDNVSFPYLVLLISGGHCLLGIVKGVDEFLLLGKSIDTAPGDVLDKVARRLKLQHLPACRNMSGGQSVEYAASVHEKENVYCDKPLTEPMLHYRNCDFSFSGMMTSVWCRIEEVELKYKESKVRSNPLSQKFQLAAAFQNVLIRHLCTRVERAVCYCKEMERTDGSTYKVSTLVASGGVASNYAIRNALRSVCSRHCLELVCPPPQYCTDNGVMIAWNGVEKLSLFGESILCWPNRDTTALAPEAKSSFGCDMRSKVENAKIKIKK